jgi:starch-binding outer membrane protein SusE/F
MKMKNLIIIFLAIIGFSFLTSCEKELKDPKLDINQTVLPVITLPADGSAYILVKAEADSVMTTFEWSTSQYNLTDIEVTKYALQMDLSGNNFADPYILTSTEGTSFSMTVGSMNNILLTKELSPDEVQGVELRVRSFINDASPYSSAYSDVITINVTPYSDEVIIKPIYLIGSATTIAWDNTLALPMEHLGDGKFARVETLTTGTDKYIKFLSRLGAWAPQWGTDAAGTSASGILVLRPDEITPDPPGIPFLTGTSGDYYIMADTLGLTYETYLTSGELYLVGDATPAGWDAGAALALTQSSPHIYTITTTLNATGGFKFLEVQGQWAPMYGTNDKGTSKLGVLVYRPNETVADPTSIPAPSTAGQYLITVDLTTMKYSVEAQ